jgi:signal peptidase I
MELRAVLVDDEQLARDELRYLLGQVGGIDVIGQAGNGAEALTVIGRLKPDIVLLDVQMPGLTGFEVARRMLDGGPSAHIIFVTAFDQHAIEAFEVNAVDYLLKPVDPGRLAVAIQRARRRVSADRLDEEEGDESQQPAEAPSRESKMDAILTNDRLEQIVQLVAERQSRRERLAIKVGERYVLVLAEEIISIASGEYQQDQGDRPLVQPELHPEDERREGDGNPGQPLPDSSASRVPEAVAQPPLPPDTSRRADERFQEETRPESVGHLPLQPESAASAAVGAFEAAFDADTAADEMRMARARVRLGQAQEELVAWLKTLVSAAVYAILIVTFGFQVARVEGQSMAPTLEDQDRLIVNKLVYRIGEPRRGDIVMLYYPLNPDKSFVKRVIAEESDTVRIVDGRVYVNDVPVRDDYIPPEYRSHDDWGPQVIPEGYDFVMGDHRNNSSDSRHWGMVPKRYIIGKVQLRWWPVTTAKIF